MSHYNVKYGHSFANMFIEYNPLKLLYTTNYSKTSFEQDQYTAQYDALSDAVNHLMYLNYSLMAACYLAPTGNQKNLFLLPAK